MSKQLTVKTNWSAQAQSIAVTTLELIGTDIRGFTGHEHVEHANIIHMNGRIYDPTLGRFLQADPHIQAPTNSQNYNRYSYVLNNPMSYTDPSEYFFKSLKKFVKKWGKMIVAAVAAYYTFGAVSGLVQGMMETAAGMCFSSMPVAAGIAGGAAAGAVSGAIMTGSLKGTLRGAFAGGITGGVTSYFGNTYSLSRVASDGVANGLATEISGGRFKDGLRMGLAVSMITYANVKIREYELEHSRKFPGQVGNSPGVRGVSGKLGGGRVVEKYWIESGAERAIQQGKSLDEAYSLYYSHKAVSPSLLGGYQGGQGMIFSENLKYPPGGFHDYIVESFAGVHDGLNHWYHYNANGTVIARTGLGYYAGEALNWANVAVATPLVVPSMIPDYLRYSVYQGIEDAN